MTWFLNLQPLQEPFDLGSPDEAGRAQWSCNFLATKRPSPSFILEVIAVLVAAGVGIDSGPNANIFGSSMATIPAGDGPFLSIRATGGTGPLGTHDGGPGAYRRPGVHVLARAATAAAAEAMAQSAFEALVAVRNQAVSA